MTFPNTGAFHVLRQLFLSRSARGRPTRSADQRGVISLRKRAGPLSERPFRLLWLGQTTSAIGDVMVGVALAFAVFQIGGGAAQLGDSLNG